MHHGYARVPLLTLDMRTTCLALPAVLCCADLVKLVQTSNSPLVQEVGDKADAEMEGKRGGQTVSSRFTGQLRELVQDLDKTGLHFVRCIKPNAALSPGQLSTELVLQQLRCCGVLEVARVSRAGYPTRYR
jgi:myosin-5